jgi:hypothetical protein
MITMITASFVLGVAAAGVAALPWREEELSESSSAWVRLAELVIGARRVEDAFAAGDADALLPVPLPHHVASLGRQTSSGYSTPSKSRAASGRSRTPARAWGSA